MTLDELIEHFNKCFSHDWNCSKCMTEQYTNCHPWKDYNVKALEYLEAYKDFIDNIKCENCDFYCEDTTNKYGETFCSSIDGWVLKNDYCSRFLERKH